jgi:hypothetical protein
MWVRVRNALSGAEMLEWSQLEGDVEDAVRARLGARASVEVVLLDAPAPSADVRALIRERLTPERRAVVLQQVTSAERSAVCVFQRAVGAGVLSAAEAAAAADDAQVAQHVVQQPGAPHFAWLSEARRGELALRAVRQCGGHLAFAGPQAQDDEETVLAAVGASSWALQFASERLRAAEKPVAAALEGQGRVLQLFASAELQQRADLQLRALTRGLFPALLVDVPAALKADAAFMLAACATSPGHVEHCSPALLQDPRFLRAAVALSDRALALAPPSLRTRELTLCAVAHRGRALSAAPEWQDDDEVVAAAVANNGDALRYASRRLRDDKKLVTAAIRSSPHSVRAASRALRADKDVALLAVRGSPLTLQWLAEAARADREVVEAAIAGNPGVLRWASPALRSNEQLAIKAVRGKAAAWLHASCEPREVVLAACDACGFDALAARPAWAADREVLQRCLAAAKRRRR